jgi:hypothetical protein
MNIRGHMYVCYFEVHTAVSKSVILWDVTLCNSVVRSTETSVDFYRTKWCHVRRSSTLFAYMCIAMTICVCVHQRIHYFERSTLSAFGHDSSQQNTQDCTVYMCQRKTLLVVCYSLSFPQRSTSNCPAMSCLNSHSQIWFILRF